MKLDVIISKYIALRDKRDALSKKQKEDMAAIKAVMDRVEGVIMAAFHEAGVDSASCPAGTAFLSQRTSATVADRAQFLDWVMADPAERGVFLESRVSSTAVEQYRDMCDDIPPGINYRRDTHLRIRRS